MKRARVWMLALCAGLLALALPLAVAAAPAEVALPQADGPDDGPSGEQPTDEEPLAGCNPAALRLATTMGVDCAVLEAYLLQGIGLGQIAQAYALSQAFPGLTWEALLARHTGVEALGWGELKKAYWLGGLVGADPETLLSAHLAGAGWGELLQPYRLEQGKPLWAAGGPPPWANGHGKPADEVSEGETSPDAVGGGRSETEQGSGGLSNGNGNGRQNGGGNGNGRGPKK
jgi:hypothetical protein